MTNIYDERLQIIYSNNKRHVVYLAILSDEKVGEPLSIVCEEWGWVVHLGAL